MSRFSSLAAAALVAVAAVPAYAQTQPAAQAQVAAPVDSQRLAAARELMQAMQVQEVLRRSVDAAFGRIQSGMIGEILNSIPDADKAKQADPHFEERMRRVNGVMQKEMTELLGEYSPRFVEATAQAYARKLTMAEMKDATAFFRSPSGAKIALIAPELVTDPSVTAVQMDMMRTMMGRMPDLMKRIEAATKDLPPPPKSDK